MVAHVKVKRPVARRKVKKAKKPKEGERVRKFKYVPFTEQMSRISVDHTTATLAIPNQVFDKAGFFYEAISKWIDLDYGDEFKSFLREIKHNELASYAQLLHHQKTIAEALIKHLGVPDSGAVSALMELTIGFAQDLREDFGEYLWDFFEALIDLIRRSPTKIDILEESFRCLVALFKFQWRNVVKNLRKALNRFSELFSAKDANIRRFVAEAAAFLMRKSPNLNKTTKYIVQKCAEAGNQHMNDGFIRLMFNTVKGTHKQFHSRSDEYLTEMLNAVLELEDENEREYGVQMLEGMMSECSQHSTAEFSAVITDFLLTKFKSALKSPNNEQLLAVLCRLLQQFVRHRRGSVFSEAERLLCICCEYVASEYEVSKEFIELCTSTVNTFSTSIPNTDVIRKLVDALAKRFGNVEGLVTLLDFFGEFMDLTIFDAWCMELLGKIFSDTISNDSNTPQLEKIVDLYVKYTLKRRPFEFAKPTFVPSIDVSPHSAVKTKLSDILKNPEKYPYELFVRTLIIYPVLCRSANDIPSGLKIKSFIEENVKSENLLNSRHCALFIASYQFRLFYPKERLGIDVNEILTLLRKYPTSETTLRTVFLLIENAKDWLQADHVQLFGDVLKALEPAIGNPFSSVRRFALMILKIFQKYLKFENKTDDNEPEVIFDLLLNVEQDPIAFETHRERGMLLHRVKYDVLYASLPTEYASELRSLTFRFILAQFHEQLTPYWKLVAETASSFETANVDEMWTVFEDQIGVSTKCVRQALSFRSPNDNLDEKETDLWSQIWGETKYRTDFASFRIEILKVLSKMPILAERKNRHVIPILFDVHDVEFQNSALLSRTEDLTILNGQEEEKDVEKEDQADDEEKEADDTQENMEVDEQAVQKTNFNSRVTRQVMTQLLKIIGNFSNLNSVFRSADLRELAYELLLTNDPEIQQDSLNCLYAFRIKELNPYRESFQKIMSNSRFREQLIRFSLDSEDPVLKPEHRNVVMPILMRILYGILRTKETKKIRPRKGAIFSFAAGCQPAELDLFVNTVFLNIGKYIGESLNDVDEGLDRTSLDKTCSSIISSYDPHDTLTSRRIFATLDCLNDVAHKLSLTLSAEQSSFIYSAAISACLLIRLALENNSVATFQRKRFRKLRAEAFQLLHKIFLSCERRAFSLEEINAFMKYIVEPYMLSSYSEVTEVSEMNIVIPLFGFFNSFKMRPIFYKLFNIPMSGELKGRTILNTMCDALLSAKVQQKEKNRIIGTLNQMLTMADEDDTIPVLPKKLKQKPLSLRKLETGQHSKREAEFPDVPFGSQLVITESNRIVDYLQNAMTEDWSRDKKLSDNHLELLEKISGFVDDPTLGREFASKLFSFVESGQLKAESRLIPILNAVCRLLVLEENPADYLRRSTPLLSSITADGARGALAKVLTAIYENPNMTEKPMVALIVKCEAWSTRRIQEPDYEKRHEALYELSQLYDRKEKIPIIAVRPLLHSHFYAFSQIDDVSTRASAANAARTLITSLRPSGQTDEFIVELFADTVFPLMDWAYRSPRENVRDEVVQTLMVCVDEYADLIESLRPLRLIRNREKTDLCFFECSTHIQKNRRRKAFSRLTDRLHEGEIDIPLEVLSRFIVPIVRPYLLPAEVKGDVSTQALALFAEITRRQPWWWYERTVGYYLTKLKDAEDCKPLVRVLVALLNVFPFDLHDVTLPQTSFTVQQGRQTRERLGGRLMDKGRSKGAFAQRNEKSVVLPPNTLQLVESAGDETAEAEPLDERQKMLASVLQNMFPRLRSALEPTRRQAKPGEKRDVEAEQVIRAPLVLAAVRLLQNLPDWAMNLHLMGVILSVLRLLLSRSINHRQYARKIIDNVVRSLGPAHLAPIIKELRTKFIRGYQLHVMIFTVYGLMTAVREKLQPGDLDECFADVYEIVRQQQFGDVDDQRQMHIIKSKVPEAKGGNHALEVMQILGEFITEKSISEIIDPMKAIFDNSPKAITQHKLRELLKALSFGLRKNQGIDAAVQLRFAKSLLNDYTSEMCRQQDALKAQELAESKERAAGYRPENCLIIPMEPRRTGEIVKVSLKSKVAIYVEFALCLVGDLLFEHRFNAESPEAVELLDPIIALIMETLQLKYEKITHAALRALGSLLKFPLPAVESHMNSFVDRFFVLLSEYANAAGTSQIGVSELNQSLFKCLVEVIRRVPPSVLTVPRLQILLAHIESDVLDVHRQATAFQLAKAIFSKQIIDEKVDNLMEYFSELCITSPLDYIRDSSRSAVFTYCRVHPHGPANAEQWINFFVEQLDYEHIHGRLSALEMIYSLFKLFNDSITDKLGLPAFVRIASRYVEETDPNCLAIVSAAVRELSASVSDSVKNDIFVVCRDWMESPKSHLRFVGSRAMTELLKVQDIKLNVGQLRAILMIAVSSLDSEIDAETINVVEWTVLLIVEMLRSRLVLFGRVLHQKGEKFVKAIIGSLPRLLDYTQIDSNSVAFAALSLHEHLLAATESVWPLVEPHADLSELAEKVVNLLSIENLDPLNAENVVKNLATLSVRLDAEQFGTLCGRLSTITKTEIREGDNRSTVKRTSLFKFTAAQLIHFDSDSTQFASIVSKLLPLMFREITGRSTTTDEALKEMAAEVSAIVRDRMGATAFTKLLADYQNAASKIAAKRRADRQELAILKPVVAVKKKQAANRRKTAARKRRIDEIKPYRALKRRRQEAAAE